MSFLHRIWRYILTLPKLYSIGGAVIIVVVAAVGVHVLTRSPADAELPPQLSHVQIASVAGLSSATGPLPVTGKVTSLDDATILSQTSGEITSLEGSLGSRVVAGQIIAEFENSSQEAAVLQAEGAYEGAEAALAKASGTTAANAGVSSSQAAATAANALSATVASLQSAYAAMDDAVHNKADAMFTNPRGITPTFNLTVADNQLAVTLQNERSQLEGVLADAKTQSTSAASANIDDNATAMNTDAQTIITFLNNLAQATNEAIATQSTPASTIATYQASASAARTEVVSAVAALAAQKSSYDAAQAGAQTASNSATSGSQNDIASAEANVKQALGALDSARANLEKTIVRSPISGTIVSLPVTLGDFVSSFAMVAEVSNPGALEVQVNVTPSDAKTLVVGGKATIGSGVSGVITSIAPALDPTTGKILVKIGITGDQSSLTDNDTVTVSLLRDSKNTATNAQTNAASSSADIFIPIVAAKLTPNGAVVFTVSSSTLVAHPITLGQIQGEQVAVTAGLTPDMDIVTDARGLTPGQQVVVDPQ